MFRVSCRAELAFRKLVDAADEDEALRLVKARLNDAAIKVASELLDEGIRTDLSVHYFVCYNEGTGNGKDD